MEYSLRTDGIGNARKKNIKLLASIPLECQPSKGSRTVQPVLK